MVINSPSNISRLWVLLQLPKLGAQFSRRGLNALRRGDQSGTVLNRVFVCGFHVFGMPSYDAPAVVHLYARRLQTAWECLAELFKGNDYRLNIRAAVLVASGFVYMRMTHTALLYIQKSCDFIKAGNVQLVPTCGSPSEFSENAYETLVALSQTIYWANYLFLMRRGPEPLATAELEKEFRRELPVGDIASIL